MESAQTLWVDTQQHRRHCHRGDGPSAQALPGISRSPTSACGDAP